MMQKLNYIRCGDYYIPDIRLQEKIRPIGRWGQLHRDYIKEHAVKNSYKNIDLTGRRKHDLERFAAKREKTAAWLRKKANGFYF